MSKRAIFDKKNVLVTGGAGFIGSHLCDELIKNSKVICIDNFSSGDERNIDHLLSEEDFEFIKHDISEPIDLEDLPELQKFKIEFQGIQEIYHLACPMSPKNFEKNKIGNIMANSYGVKNILDLARKYDSKFMHFSSSVIYGPRQKDNKKISENELGLVDHLSIRSSYDEGKRFAETFVLNYRHEYNVDAKIIRLFRIYGPRMKLDDNQMIPDFINNAIDGNDLIIHGDENFSSSFCYISDVIDAVVKMMDSEFYGPINIGSDVEINISDVASLVIGLLESSSNIAYESEKLFMSQLPLPDTTKARNELGWLPIVTIEKGLERTINDLRAKKGMRGISQAL